jgi:DnaJ-domain-containing protein 1
MILLAAALVIGLLWFSLGRPGLAQMGAARWAGALLGVAVAAAAVVAAARGAWLAGLVLAALATYLGYVGAPTTRRPLPAPPPTSLMTEREARDLLGVSETAGPGEIEAAYRRLMKIAHPDQGGSTGLAAQLNSARARLLRP